MHIEDGIVIRDWPVVIIIQCIMVTFLIFKNLNTCKKTNHEITCLPIYQFDPKISHFDAIPINTIEKVFSNLMWIEIFLKCFNDN